MGRMWWKKIAEHLVTFLWAGFYCFGGAILLTIGIVISLFMGIGVVTQEVLCLDSPLVLLLTPPLAAFGCFVLLPYIYRIGDWLFDKIADIID